MPRIPRAIAVASEPTAGRGYALDAKGRIPLAMESGRWTLEFVTVTLDIANTAAHTGGSQSVTIPNLQVGDICIWAGTDTSANAMQYWNRTELRYQRDDCAPSLQCRRRCYRSRVNLALLLRIPQVHYLMKF